MDRVVFHGNNKSVTELERAVSAGVGRVVVDSYEEVARLAAVAAIHGVRQRVMVRTTVGVEAHTHEYIATAHEDQKFGFSIAGGHAAEAVRQVLSQPSLELVGLHSHIGSQIYDTSGFEIAARRVVALHARIRDEHGVELPEIDLGGGFGIAYTSQDDPAPIADLAKGIREIVERECRAEGVAVPRLAVEPGRAIVGPTTFTVYEVGTVKPVELDAGAARTYVSVDGGMSDNIRTALYDAAYSCTIASRVSDAPPVLARVVGKHCESGDVVVRDEFLPVTCGRVTCSPFPARVRTAEAWRATTTPFRVARGGRTRWCGEGHRPPRDRAGPAQLGCGVRSGRGSGGRLPYGRIAAHTGRRAPVSWE
jgi:diaminopimelate decarboxylase